MRGIAGIYFKSTKKRPISETQVEDLIDGLLLGIESRGRDATGIATMTTKGEIDVEKADIDASKFILWRRPEMLKKNTRSILLHTRFATQGSPQNLNNNHPIPYGNTVVVHNGHISNDKILFLNEDVDRIAQVDSEIIAALFDKYGLDKAHLPLQKLDGNFAVAVADSRHPNSLVLAKGYSSPLVMYDYENMLIWASTEAAIENAVDYALEHKTKKMDFSELKVGEILYLENGEPTSLSFEPYEDMNTWKYGFNSWSSSDKKKNTDTSVTIYKASQKNKWTRTAKKDEEFSWQDVNYVICADCLTSEEKEDAIFVPMIGYLCDDCYIGSDIVDSLVNTGKLPPQKKDEDEKLQDEHEFVLEMVAEKYNVSPGYVEWLIFDSGIPDGQVRGGRMLTDFNDYSEAYDDFYTELLGEEDDDEAEIVTDDFSFVNRQLTQGV